MAKDNLLYIQRCNFQNIFENNYFNLNLAPQFCFGLQFWFSFDQTEGYITKMLYHAINDILSCLGYSFKIFWNKLCNNGKHIPRPTVVRLFKLSFSIPVYY